MSAPQTPQDLPQGEELAALVSARLKDIPDFPKPGVVFKDFTPLLRDPAASRAVVQDVVRRRQGDVDVVVGIEARGFILGAAMAYALGVGFVPVRKAGKLPGETHSASYTLGHRWHGRGLCLARAGRRRQRGRRRGGAGAGLPGRTEAARGHRRGEPGRPGVTSGLPRAHGIPPDCGSRHVMRAEGGLRRIIPA